MTEPSSIADIASAITTPDEHAAANARARQLQLTKPAGALGRLEDLSIWAAATQGQCPPHDFHRARVVVFAGDHGVAAHGVSAYPVEVTQQMVANFAAGGAAVNVLADAAGATVRVLDLSVAVDTEPSVSDFKVRFGSGSIDREDALTDDETWQAFTAGVTVADQEVDAGADLLIPADMGIGNTTIAAAVISVLTGTEPIRVIGRGTGIDDAGWIRKCAAVRDARRRAWPYRHDMLALLRTIGGADLAAMTGFILQGAARRTPILLDGLMSAAAALVAQHCAVQVVDWLQAGHRSTEPAQQLALAALGLDPIVDLQLRLGEGSGALVALPVLRAAIRCLGEMATFADAGVSDRVES